MTEKERAIIAAAQRVIDAVEFDESNAMMNIKMPNMEYGFELDQKIENPLADAIVRLAAEIDRMD